jgi:hypothetical protein
LGSAFRNRPEVDVDEVMRGLHDVGHWSDQNGLLWIQRSKKA